MTSRHLLAVVSGCSSCLRVLWQLLCFALQFFFRYLRGVVPNLDCKGLGHALLVLFSCISSNILSCTAFFLACFWGRAFPASIFFLACIMTQHQFTHCVPTMPEFSRPKDAQQTSFIRGWGVLGF